MSGVIEARLRALGVELPPAPPAVANYVPFAMAGGFLYVSGQLSKAADGTLVTGRLGDGLSVADGHAAARLCAINILAQAKAALGELDRIRLLVRLSGFVSASPAFTDHPLVVNGASDLMGDALGEKGKHSRIAVGVAGLPANCAVEVDAIFAVD